MIIHEFFYLILIFLFGWILVSLVSSRLTIEEHVGLSILLGLGGHSILFFIFVIWFRCFSLNSWSFLVAENIIFGLTLLLFGKTSEHMEISEAENKRVLLQTILKLVSLFVLLFTLLQCVYWPVYETDSLYLYDFRAKLLLNSDLLTFFSGTSFYPNGIYPPFTTLGHYFMYQAGFTNPKIFYFLIFLAFYLVLTGFVKRVTDSKTLGLLAGMFTILTPSVWWNSILAEPGIAYMAFLSLAVVYLFITEFENKNTLGGAALGAILLGLCAWTRSEPFWLIPAFIYIARCLVEIKLRNIVIFGVIFISISQLWTVGLQSHLIFEDNVSIVANGEAVSVPLQLSRPIYTVQAQMDTMRHYDISLVRQVLTYFFNSFYNAWGLVLPLFVVIILAETLILKRMVGWIEFVAICLTAAIVLSTVNFSHQFPEWMKLDSSVYRMSIITIPLYWVTIVSSRIWRKFYERGD
jgi:hypothetical protein